MLFEGDNGNRVLPRIFGSPSRTGLNASQDALKKSLNSKLLDIRKLVSYIFFSPHSKSGPENFKRILAAVKILYIRRIDTIATNYIRLVRS